MMKNSKFKKQYLINTFQKIIFFLILSFQTNVFAYESSDALCILIYERGEHAVVHYIQTLFKGSKNTRLIPTARPMDLIQCIKEGANELLVIAHSQELSHRKDLANLIFFMPFAMKERDLKISDTQSKTLEKLKKLNWEPRNGYIDKNQFDFMTIEKEERSNQINQLMQQYLDMEFFKEKKYNFYTKDIFDSYFFDLMYEELKKQKEKRGHINLKTIRMMTCQPQKVLSRYPTFNQMAKDFDISFDIPTKKMAFEYYAEIRTGMKNVKNMFNKKWYLGSFRDQ